MEREGRTRFYCASGSSNCLGGPSPRLRPRHAQPIEQNEADSRHARRTAQVGRAYPTCPHIPSRRSIADGGVAGAEGWSRTASPSSHNPASSIGFADLHRLQGQLALRRPEPDRPSAGPALSRRSRSPAARKRRQLRAANDLARLWRDNRSDRDPRALLQPILATIEGGETSRDVRNARTLLAELV